MNGIRFGQMRRPMMLVTTAASAVVLGMAARADASNEALLRLLQVLRDRGSITATEYEEIRLVAEADAQPGASGAAPAAPPAAVLALSAKPPQGAGPSAAVTAAASPGAVATATGAATATAGGGSTHDLQPAIAKALAGKWYEKLGLRGYTQFRYEDVVGVQGLPVEVPSDRAVNKNESFMIRRGRFVFSGDTTERLSLYAQVDYQASTGAADFSVQARDLYADVSLDKAKAWRVRLGQSKVPFGFVNMQSSQNRAPLERPDALNSAVEGERDLGAALMWASPESRKRFRDLTSLGLKGSGDYGIVAVGAYAGQGLNRSDQNGKPHVFARAQYPFKLSSGQYFELGVQAYHGRFVTPTQTISIGGSSFTPAQRSDGELDQRVAATFVWYPQPIGLEAEWTAGRGPVLDTSSRSIALDGLQGGYVQLHYRRQSRNWTWFPFSRWNYYDGSRKFARNAPRTKVNEMDFGLEFARWAEVEITGMFSHTFTRTRTSAFPYDQSRSGNRVGVQVQWNY